MSPASAWGDLRPRNDASPGDPPRLASTISEVSENYLAANPARPQAPTSPAPRRKRRARVDRDVGSAQGHGGKPKPRQLRFWKWQPIRHRTLAGFVSVEFGIGLRIADLPVFRTGTTGPWVGQPRAPKLDSAGRQLRGDDGQLLFEATFAWRDRATSDRFSAAVIALLLKKHPDALDPPRDQRDRSAAAPIQPEIGL
jgi:hypothetical protein